MGEKLKSTSPNAIPLKNWLETISVKEHLMNCCHISMNDIQKSLGGRGGGGEEATQSLLNSYFSVKKCQIWTSVLVQQDYHILIGRNCTNNYGQCSFILTALQININKYIYIYIYKCTVQKFICTAYIEYTYIYSTGVCVCVCVYNSGIGKHNTG